MNAGEPTKRSLLSGHWVQLVILLAMSAGNLIETPSFRKDRPADLPLGLEEAEGSQRIPARLFEDPLKAVHSWFSAEKETAPSSRPTSGELDLLLETAGGATVTLLVMLVPGGSYQDDHEIRLRIRYALQAALLSEEFMPQESRRLGGRLVEVPRYGPMAVAFETFERSSGDKPARVFVTWVNEERACADFASHLGRILRAFAPKAFAASRTLLENLRIRIVGPSNSGDLDRLLEPKDPPKRDGGSPDGTSEVATPALLVSPWATAPPKRSSKGGDESVDLPVAGMKVRLRVARTLESDRAIADLLVGELCRRGCCVGERAKKTLLLLEGDSRYAREWREHLGNAVAAESCAGHSGCRPNCEVEHFQTLSYLRGLDGATPMVRRGGDRAGGEEDIASGEAAERGEGTSQLDYLRRLQRKVARRLRAHHDEIRAIGIVGSDVHDKLLILQALRPIATGVVFFTSDLDARLFEKRRWEDTRNVLVASHYGLELREELQGEVLPFRDGYQTSTFLACKAALGRVPHAQDEKWSWRSEPDVLFSGGEAFETIAGQLKAAIPKPRLYEMARGRAYDISPEAHDGEGSSRADVTPPRTRSIPGFSMDGWAAAACAASAFLVLLAWARRLRRLVAGALQDIRLGRLKSGGLWTLGLPFLSALGLYLSIRFSVRDPAGEPFSLWGGVSAWPAQIMRLVAIWVAVFSLFHQRTRFRETASAIAKRFALEGMPPSVWSEAGKGKKVSALLRFWWNELEEGWRRTFGKVSEPEGESLPGRKLWNDFLARSVWEATVPRVALRVLPWLALFGASWWLLGLPPRPIRGSLAGVVDWILLSCACFLVVVLMLTVSHAARFFRDFARVLSQNQIAWGTATIEKTKPSSRDPRVVSLLTEMRIVETLSETFSRWVYPPAIVGLLLLVARSRIFDDWAWPVPFVVAVVGTAVGVLVSAFLLRRTAVQSRENALDDLRRLEDALDREKDAAAIQEIESVREEITAMKKGAFRPFAEDPLLRAALIPVGGVGLLSLGEDFGLGG